METDSGQNFPPFAEDFFDIPSTLARNTALLASMCELITSQPTPGKVTEGGDRLDRLRLILTDLAHGRIGYYDAFHRAEIELPRRASRYSRLNNVFPDGWGERLIRTQFSRFYNQAVMEHLLALGETECHVPHSRNELSGTRCTSFLAGRNHNLRRLHEQTVNSYAFGRWDQTAAKIPDHPHCTHVVVPRRTVASPAPWRGL